jgi:hypothetical protein
MIQESARATNLWVIAKYGPDNEVKRVFQLKIPISGTKPELDDKGGEIIENIDASWLADEHEIVVKFYNNVMKSGNTARAGFMVMIDGYICAVVKACEINSANVINPNNVVYADGDTAYLGFAATAIDDSVGQRYAKDQLLLSIIESNHSLSSVDFQGQGVIDNVALATSGFDFGPDATVVTFEGYNSAAIKSITYGGKDVTGGAYTIIGNENFGDTVNIVVTLNSGYALEDENGDIHTDSCTFSKTPATASETITLDVFKIKAYVEKVACRSFADALNTVKANGGTLKLMESFSGTDLHVDSKVLKITGSKAVVLDLNGYTITGSSDVLATIVNNGILTIKDSVGTGVVADSGAGSVLNDGGTLTIEGGKFAAAVKTQGYVDDSDETPVAYGAVVTVVGGTFDGAFTVDVPAADAGYTVTATVTGGKFLTSANNTVADLLDTDNYELDTTTENGYSIVVAKSEDADDFENSKVVVDVENAAAEDAEKVDAALEQIAAEIGSGAGDVEVKDYLDKFYTSENKVTAAVLAGALDNGTIGLSVKYNLPLMEETPVIDVTTEAADATNDESAAFSFQIKVKGNALSVAALEEALDTVRTMIEYGTDLKQMGQLLGTNTDVDLDVDTDNNKIKVKMKNTQSKGFMKVKLSK